jgi:NADH-quinone oxidoreductase subunit L
MVRLWKLVFLGTPRSDEASHAHEGGLSMTLPLVVLAALSVVGGYAGVFKKLAGGIAMLVPEAEGSAHSVIFATSLAVMLLGAGAALLLYKSAPADALQQKSPGLFGLLTALKESFDAIYDYYVAKIQQRFAMVLNFLDQIALGGLIVRGGARLVGLLGLGARALHVGSLHAYVYWFLIGAALLWAYAAGAF